MKRQLRELDFFKKYISIYENDVFRYSLSLAKDADQASDILQNTMLQAWVHLDQLKDVTKAKAWIFTIAHNEAMKLLNEKNKEIARRYVWAEGNNADEDETDPLLNIPDFIDDILDQLVMADNVAVLREALERLKPEDAAIIKMRYLDGLEPKEIGMLLNQKSSTVRSALCRAIKKMRDTFYEIDGGRYEAEK